MPAPSADLHGKYRRDIDGLRAVAVLAVVAFHVFPGRVRGGFVGVDIFFVISGYLISGIIFRGVELGRFRFSDFYARRVRRIFPALLLVLASCLTFGWIALLGDEYRRLGKHVAGGAGFISNWISWAEAGYFDSTAELKPLLHLWSLGIEEQFYLIWPPLVLLTARRRLGVPALILALLVVPFGLNVWRVHGDSEMAFYLPFTRFWELILGGALAWLASRSSSAGGLRPPRIQPWHRQVMGAAGLALIAASIALLNRDRAFPGWWAVLPTTGAFFTIAAGEDTWTNRTVLSNRVAVWVGVISYPLYLWHWPLLSFARILSRDLPTRQLKLVLVAVSVLLAWLTYRFIERPVRSAPRSRALPLAFAGAIGLAGVAGLFVFARDGLPARFPGFSSQLAQLDWPYWRNATCEGRYRFDTEHAWWFCMLNDAPPRIVLLGNSHANHLYPGLVGENELAGQGILSIGACDPLDGVIFRSSDTQAADPCRDGHNLEGNAFILRSLKETPSIRYAILSSVWPSYAADGSAMPGQHGPRWEIVPTDEREATLPIRERYFAALARYVSLLEAQGIRVILSYDTPRLAYDARDCLDIRPFPKRPKKDCVVSAVEERARQSTIRAFAARLSALHPSLKIFDPLPVFCGEAVCRLVRDDHVLLRDQHHLSMAGSRVFADAFVAWARTNLPDLVGAGPPVATTTRP